MRMLTVTDVFSSSLSPPLAGDIILFDCFVSASAPALAFSVRALFPAVLAGGGPLAELW